VSLRIVFDTNTRISAIVFKGTPLEALDHACSPAFDQFISHALLDELENVLTRKFHGRGVAIDLELAALQRQAHRVQPTETITACRDKDDNRVLECAVAAQAQLIVSGDNDLLTLCSFRGIRILTARAFLDEFRSSPSTPHPTP
jgi:putative PIN family toxin of toxin-antitoxin system